MTDAAADFLGVLVLLILFIGWCYMSYRVAIWVFKRDIRKQVEKSGQVYEQQEKEAIAARLRQGQRRKDLEEQVRREMIERGELPPDNLNNPSLCIPFGDNPDKVQRFFFYLTVIIQRNSTCSNLQT